MGLICARGKADSLFIIRPGREPIGFSHLNGKRPNGGHRGL